MPSHFQAVTRTADLLRAAGVRLVALPKIQIDADEHETIRKELCNHRADYDGDASIITGLHEHLGRVTLRRDSGVFTVEAEDTSFVRPIGDGTRRE